MHLGLIIFLLALTIRILNLLFLDIDSNEYLYEDQKMYWDWALKGAYLPWSILSDNILSERMPGAFLFFEFLQWVTAKNLFLILFFQAMLDAATCFILYKCACLVNKKYSILTGLFAAFSPLLIIISSQILSDTIFLFVFSCALYSLLKFSKKESPLYYLVFSGLMLGGATFIRAATFPLIFLCLPIIFLIIKSKKYSSKKFLFSFLLFFIASIIPISDRLFTNILGNETFSLTSQSGSHAAYWMVPGVLSLNNNYNRQEAVAYINERIANKGGLEGTPYKDSKKLFSVSLEILSEQDFTDIFYAWGRASFLNIITPAILIDGRVRNLKHFSFAEEGKIYQWLVKNTLTQDSKTYLVILFLSSIIGAFSLFSIFIGFYYLIKSNYNLAILSICIILYFSIITGPTLSPKYCIPFLPIIFYLQSIFSFKLLNLSKNLKLNKFFS